MYSNIFSEIEMKLTPRQREIFRFITSFVREKGYPPSVREIAERFRIYPRAAFDHLKALERKGYLRRRSTVSRGLEILVFQHEDDRALSGKGTEERSFVSGKTMAIREIPILGRVTAGKPVLAVEHVEGTLPLPAEWTNGGEVFLLKVKGESMAPYILSEDYVIVRSQPSAENGEVVVALVGGEATVKRFFKRGDWIDLEPDNREWETLRIDGRNGDVQILGKVIGVFRKC